MAFQDKGVAQDQIMCRNYAMQDLVQLTGSWIGHNGLLAQQVVGMETRLDKEFAAVSVNVTEQLEKTVVAMLGIVLQNGAHGVRLVVVMSLVEVALSSEHENAHAA